MSGPAILLLRRIRPWANNPKYDVRVGTDGPIGYVYLVVVHAVCLASFCIGA